jgi:hypothetical protein
MTLTRIYRSSTTTKGSIMKGGIVVVTVFVVIFCCGFFCGLQVEEIWNQESAITAKVGEYVMNPTNGVSTFQFKTNLVEACREGK